MSDRDAYQGEMARRDGLSDEEVEALLAGIAREGEHPELALFLATVREQATIDDTTTARHLDAISQEAERVAAGLRPVAGPHVVASPTPTWRRVMQRSSRLIAQTTAGVVVLSMSMIGLAYAGVDLPGTAAEKALEKVTPLDLPNQGGQEGAEATTSGKSVADDVKAVIESSTTRGCPFGQAVAEVASQNRQGDGGSDKDPCARGAEDKDGNDPQGSKATGEERSAKGRAIAADKSGGASEGGTGDEAKNDGAGNGDPEGAQSKGEENRSPKADGGADNAGSHDDKGAEQSAKESAKGTETSSAASDNGKGSGR
jgi:hypothetical protein